MNKKLIIPIISLVITLSLCACQSSSDGSAPPVKEAPQPSASAEKDMVLDFGDRFPNSTENTVSVNSHETVSVIPDIAQVVYSVRTEEQSAGACQKKNSEAVSSVIALLKELGVEESSIQTSDYYMDPRYNYSGNTAKLIGYEATATLTVSDLPIEGLDEILSKSVDGGINTIRSITYMASKYDESYQEALQKAMDSAYQKAQVLASACGRNIGNAVNITETSGYSQARYDDTARTGMMKSMAKMDAVAELSDTAGIMPGEISVEASIIVEYQLY